MKSLFENYEITEEIIDLVVEENSEITITDKRSNGETTLLLKKGAKVNYISKGDVIRKVVVEECAEFYCYDLGTKMDSVTMLVGENSLCEHYGLRKGSGEWKITIHHQASNTTSNLHTRVLLAKNERARVDGLVKIDEACPGAEGDQRIETLLLDPTARIYALPQLEIATNEVKCSHGATITKLNEESLFYLLSRGIPEHKAKELLIEGFLNFNEEITKLLEVQ